MFKYKPSVAMYESNGVFSKLFLVTHNRFRDIYNCLFNDEYPNICLVGSTHKHKQIYNIDTLLFILSTCIVLFCYLMHQKSDKSISIRQNRGRQF